MISSALVIDQCLFFLIAGELSHIRMLLYEDLRLPGMKEKTEFLFCKDAEFLAGTKSKEGLRDATSRRFTCFGNDADEAVSIRRANIDKKNGSFTKFMKGY